MSATLRCGGPASSKRDEALPAISAPTGMDAVSELPKSTRVTVTPELNQPFKIESRTLFNPQFELPAFHFSAPSVSFPRIFPTSNSMAHFSSVYQPIVTTFSNPVSVSFSEPACSRPLCSTGVGVGPGFTMSSASMHSDVNPPTTIPAPQLNIFESRLQELASTDRRLPPPPPPRHQGARGQSMFNQCPRRSEEQPRKRPRLKLVRYRLLHRIKLPLHLNSIP